MSSFSWQRVSCAVHFYINVLPLMSRFGVMIMAVIAVVIDVQWF